MNLSNIRQFILLGLMTGYLMLSYAFMQIRIPPSGFGVPLGELFLFFALATISVPRVLEKMGAVVYLLPFLVWWGLGLGRVLIDSSDRGFWAFRDATPLIESLYIIVGFAIAGSPKFIDRLDRWLPVLLAVCSIYSLGFPFADQLQAISPSVPGASLSTLAIPILGNFSTAATMLLWSAFYLLCVEKKNDRLQYPKIAVAGGLIAFAVVVVQTRTIYFQLLGLMFICLLFRRKALGKMGLAFPLLLVVIAAITAFDLRVSGRLTDKISFSFFLDHLTAIFGQTTASDGSNLTAAAEGVNLRFGWWLKLYQRLTGDAVYLLTGLGYGIALTDFHGDNAALVREPHNSYISAVSRLGLIGFLAWVWMTVESVRAWLSVYRRAGRLQWRHDQDLLLLILAFAAVLVLLSGLGEDALEKPYHAIPLYTLWGVVLRIAYALRRQTVAASVPSIPAVARHATQVAPLYTFHQPEHSR